MTAGPTEFSPARSQHRPRLHFTARRGWINDPYGVHWDGSRYHLYYQAVVTGTSWAPECAWGHAVSEDLVAWHEQAPSLVPQAFELGCWSGCVVVDPGGAVTAFYTRVDNGNRELAAIAVATAPSADEPMVSGPESIVVAAAPAELDLTAFRDPYIVRDTLGWLMVVGAGTADGSGAVLQYRSTDLRRWQYAGVLHSGRTAGAGDDTTEVWECPQFLEVGDRWVLIVSVMTDGAGDRVVATVGTFDGGSFVPAVDWQPLTAGVPYATSAFVDRAGQPCLVSWLREDGRHDYDSRDWAGAHSVVARLGVGADDRITVTPHPDLDAHVAAGRGAGPTPYPTSDATRWTLSAAGRRGVEVVSESGRCLLRVDIGADGGEHRGGASTP